MKINPILNPNILRSYHANKSVMATTVVESGKDEVSFSQEALNFSKALSEAREATETRTPAEQAHIAEITTAVRQGQYRIDSGAVAEKILESVQGRK